MSNFHLIIPNRLSNFTLTTYPGASAGFPVGNVASSLRSLVFRSAYLNLSQISGSSATAISISSAALAAANFTSAAQVNFYGYSDAAFTTQIYTSGLINANADGGFWQKFFPAISVRSWIFNIIDAANPAGYIQVGTAFVGTDFNPEFGVSWSPVVDSKSTTRLDFTASGSPLVETGIDYREVAVQFGYLSNAEAQTLEDACYDAVAGSIGWLSLDSNFSGRKQARHSGEFVLTEYPAIRLESASIATAGLSGRLL